MVDEKMKTVSGRILSSTKIQGHNSFSEPEKLKPADFKDAIPGKKSLAITLPAASVVVLKVQ